MSRSAADATRFTATGPYANSKSGAPAYKLPGFMNKPNTNANNGSNPSQGSPSHGEGPPGETPKQKVERLRAQARAQRMAQSNSGFDRLLSAGREVANKAHKVTVYSLIAASGMCPHPNLCSSYTSSFFYSIRWMANLLVGGLKASAESSLSIP